MAVTIRPTLDRRALVIEALRGEQTFEEFAAERGLAVSTMRRALRIYLREKMPPIGGAVSSPVGHEVDIVRDQWGIPHIFAETAQDLYFGFGFAVAQDRLWQLDYRRRAAYGTLAEVLGPDAVAGDLTARTLNFVAIAEAEMVDHPATTRRALEAYAAGINHGIAHFGDELPIEFDVLGYRPEPWRAADSVAIARAALWQFSGRIENIVLAEAALRLPDGLAERFLRVEAADESIVPAEPRKVEGRTAAAGAPSVARGRSSEPSDAGRPHGSNQWAVGPALAAKGKPLLASDGHVPFTQPSSRYEVHLCGAGIDVIGITDPGVPLIGNGRSRHVAWGLTNNVSSVRDLYVEDLNPNNSDEVWNGERWVPLWTRTEEIRVHGSDPVVKVIRSTPCGPLVNELIPSVEPDGDPPLALRWVGLEPHDSITAGLQLAQATSVDEVREIHRGWQLSCQNPGFADDRGHIGYQMRGRFPRRGRPTRGYRALSEPADTWAAPLSFDALPSMEDPPRGWIGSANQRPHPVNSDLPLYGAYGDGYRGRRMRTLIEGGRDYTLADMAEMQIDCYSERAAALKDRLADLIEGNAATPPDDERDDPTPTSDDRPPPLSVVRLLRRWDCRYTIGSVAASLFTGFWLRWTERVAAARFPKHLAHAAAGAAGAVAHDLLLEGDFGWFPARDGDTDPTDRVRAEVCAALDEALAWLAAQLGTDWWRWTWGRLHPITLTHPLSAGRPVFTKVFDLGPLPCPGGPGVLNQNGFRTGERFETTSGPHYRFLCDLAEPGQAEGVNTAGNSGHPTSPHYRDQFGDWLGGRYHKLLMDRGEIEAQAGSTTRLLPPRDGHA